MSIPSPVNNYENADRIPLEAEEFTELVRYTGVGYVGGLLLGLALDAVGLQLSGLGQALVRTVAGESESLLEGVFALRRHLRGATDSMAEAYGWGKVVGMAAPWLIDGASRLGGVDVYDVPGFYIPYFYALADQLGGNLSSLLYLRRAEGAWAPALHRYIRHPVMQASLAVLLLAPLGLLGARLAGFSPNTQVFTALETIVANLCWVPPLVGWLAERKQARD